MKIFSKHRKIEPKRRFGGMEFRNKIKAAGNYKRAFSPTGNLSISFLPHGGIYVRTLKVLSFVLLLAGVYYFVIAPNLQITEITIKGNAQVSAQQIKDILETNGNSRLLLIKKNNFFLMSRGRVNQLLTDSIPTIKEVVHYDRSWPNKALIEVVEHTPGFVILSNNNYFLIDDEGMVVEQIEDPNKWLVVEDQLTESFAQGEALPNPRLASFIISMSKMWNSKISTPIKLMKFPGKSSNEVQIVTEMGWAVMFDTTRPVSVQLDDLVVIITKQIKSSELPNLAYIDLRLSKWAYYCFKASPCEQRERPTEAGTSTTNE